jgi:O-antigen ligase
VARWSAIGLGFSIPLTVALNNLMLTLSLAGWLFGSAFRGKLKTFGHPVAIPAVVLYGLTVVASTYGESDIALAALHLRKYADLLLIPVFLWLFRDPATRRHGVHALAASLAFVLALSYLTTAGIVPPNPLTSGNPEYPVVFKQHLTHNILVAFGMFLFVWLAVTAESVKKRAGWAALTVLALINGTILVHGATGYLILAALILLTGYRFRGWRGAGAGLLGIALFAVTLMGTTNAFQARVTKIQQELYALQPDQPAETSTALRLEFYRNTLSIIAERPLIGVGTGGFASAYAEKVKGTGKVATQNPHNEFLLMWAQLGIAGLAALIWMFARQWRLAAQLPTRLESELARGLVVTMVIGCMLNSLLLDHTEGLFFAWLTGVLYGGLKWPLPDKDARSATRTIAPTPVP